MVSHRQYTLPLAGYLCLFMATLAFGHNPDTSYLSLDVGDKAIEIRLSYDVITLLAIVPGLDSDGNKAVSKDELTAAEPVIRSYLEAKVVFEIDGHPATLGDPLPITWPTDQPGAIPQTEYHQVVLHFPYKIDRTPPDDLTFIFDVFTEFGERHMVLSKLGYLDFSEEILFRLEEPDYLLDLAYIRDRQVSTPALSPSPPSSASHGPVEDTPESPLWLFISLPVALLLPPLLRKMSTRSAH